MSDSVERILDRVSWMSWEEKVHLFRSLCDYVGEDEVQAAVTAFEAARRERVRPIDCTIVTFVHRGRAFSVAVANRYDVIQCRHYNGSFYDPEGLAIIERHFDAGGVFLDVGANVGNHAIFAAGVLGASRVIAIEPNPPAMRLLDVNVRLSGLAGIVDLRYLGYGLSDSASHANAVDRPDNLGATKLTQDVQAGNIRLITGDELLKDEIISFIKIDVEGMELAVLRGMKQIIRRFKPPIFIEIADVNASEFREFVEVELYQIVGAHRRSDANENVMIIPRKQ